MSDAPTVVRNAISFECPSCTRTLRAAAEFAGQLARCPACRAMANVPGTAATPTASREGATAPLHPKTESAHPRPPKCSFVRFACPSCQASVSAAPQYAGLPGPCPSCGATITVPQPPPPTAEGATLPTSWPDRPPPPNPSVPGFG